MSEIPLLEKISKEYCYFGGLSLLYGFIFSFCLYGTMSGITFPICIICTIIFVILFMNKINHKRKKDSFVYIIGMILLGISTTLTTSFFIHFFNLMGIILLFFVFMLHQFFDDQEWEFPLYLKRIVFLFGTILECIPLPYNHAYVYLNKNKENKKKTTLLAIIIGIIVAIGITSIILPLLLKSDIIFSNLLGDFFKDINIGGIIGRLLLVVMGFTFSYAFFGAICKYNIPIVKEGNKKYYNPVIGITFTSFISVIYFIYCIVQIMYLFVGIQNGLPEGVTYSEYARSGFWELLFVTIINFVMILICKNIFHENIILKVILTIISACTFVMIASAMYRMIMYIEAYHLTFLRILVLWFLIVLTLLMAGMILSIYKKRFPLFHYIVVVISVMYIVFSFSRPDTIIAEYNISHSENMRVEDINYLMYNTSLDAAPYIAEINLENVVDKDDCIEEEIYNYFCYISETNENISLKETNYSKIKAKKAADKYIEKYENRVE